MPTTPKTIVLALGNPGEAYTNTYHNAGVLALPVFIETLTGVAAETLEWKTHKNLFSYAKEGNFIFVRSLTFMNESGIAAAEVLKKFNAMPEHLVLLHDESDLVLGDFKISFDRSSGGNKGAQSVIDHLKTQTFWRVRIGIRPAQEAKRQKAGDFVLKAITRTAEKILHKVFRDAASSIERHRKQIATGTRLDA